MSSSFVARTVFDKVRRRFPEYQIKFSSDNPRNPANLASSEERKMLEYFREHPEAERWVGKINMGSREYLAQFDDTGCSNHEPLFASGQIACLNVKYVFVLTGNLLEIFDDGNPV